MPPDYSLIHEVRARLLEVERPFVFIAGMEHGQTLGGVDLLILRRHLSTEGFRSYIEVCRELRQMERAEKKLADASKSQVVSAGDTVLAVAEPTEN